MEQEISAHNSTVDKEIFSHNSTAEKAVISCMLLDESACETALLSLTREHFLDEDCARAFSAIQIAHQQGFEIGLQSVSSIVDVEFIPKLVEIFTCVPTSANFEVYLKTLKDEYRNRRFADDFTELVERARNGDTEIIADAQQALFKYTRDVDIGLKPIRNYVAEAINKLGNQEKGIPTGFYDLDKTIRGLCKGDMIIVAGRPSMGKSSFVANIATNVALNGYVVCYFSLEMTSVSIVQRMIFSMIGHSEQEILNDMKSDNPVVTQEVFETQPAIDAMKFYLNESTSVTVNKIVLECKKVAALEGKVDLVVIDYLGLIQSEMKSSTRNQEVAEISHSIKRLAKELDVPVILVSQLNRNSEGRADHTPIMADLSESGALEADADVVLFPYRPWVYDKEEYSQTDAELIVAKNRNGETKRIPLYWQGEQFTFKNVAYESKD